MTIIYSIADYTNRIHANAVVALLDDYANDPMGGAEPLSDETKNKLASSLANVPGAFSVLAQLDGEYVGLANCFTGFSTFACKPLINIHDLSVVASARGKKVGQGLLEFVASEAQRRGCCKVTLEVLEGNTRARAVYEKAGFAAYTLDDTTGHALFLHKSLQKKL